MAKHDARRALKLDCLRDSVTEVRRLQENGYSRVGEWSLSQACQHLSKTLQMSMEGAPFSVPFFLKPVARFLFFRRMMDGKPIRLSVKADPYFLPNEVGSDSEADIAEYEQLVSQVMADETDLIPNHPVFGKVSKDEWRKFHAWHAAHHLSFLVPAESPAVLETAQPTVN